MSDELDHHEVLQVRPDASEDVIRAAYRALARRYHPDTSVDAESVPQMVLVNRAWEILGNAERRSLYDREHGIEPRPTVSAEGAHPRATWSGPGEARAAGASGPVHDAGPGGPGFGGGRPPVQRRGADGRVIEWRNAPDGTGGAGEPPGLPSGTILPFGRFIAWSIGEIARYDPGYLEWLDQRPEGVPYRAEIDATLKRLGWRQKPVSRDQGKRWGR